MPSVRANGLTLEYESLGDPAHPAIVLIMGLGMQLVGWPEEFCRTLAARGYRVVRVLDRNVSWVDVRIDGDGYAVRHRN